MTTKSKRTTITLNETDLANLQAARELFDSRSDNETVRRALRISANLNKISKANPKGPNASLGRDLENE